LSCSPKDNLSQLTPFSSHRSRSVRSRASIRRGASGEGASRHDPVQSSVRKSTTGRRPLRSAGKACRPRRPRWPRRNRTSAIRCCRAFSARFQRCQNTIASETRRDSLRLTPIREQGGVTALVGVCQAESLVTTTTASIPPIQQQIEQTGNQINSTDVSRGVYSAELTLARARLNDLASVLQFYNAPGSGRHQ
jgi:hypothetical protein